MIPTVGFNMRKITKGNVTIKVCVQNQSINQPINRTVSESFAFPVGTSHPTILLIVFNMLEASCLFYITDKTLTVRALIDRLTAHVEIIDGDRVGCVAELLDFTCGRFWWNYSVSYFCKLFFSRFSYCSYGILVGNLDSGACGSVTVAASRPLVSNDQSHRRKSHWRSDHHPISLYP